MKPARSIMAIADDLTGAAEIAAIGHRLGLHARLSTGGRMEPGSGLEVFDTNTRLASPASAARTLARVGARVGRCNPDLIFKKTDSVLRGPVVAELVALMKALAKPAALLVPANPSLGRVIHHGRYLVNGVPLHQTGFARDPHHPAHTCLVAELLGAQAPVKIVWTGDAPPRSGIALGEATRAADVTRWARSLDARTLAAGGADFFSAVLRARGCTAIAAPVPPWPAGPTLIVRGAPSASAAGRRTLSLPAAVINGTRDAARSLDHWIESVLKTLARKSVAVVTTGRMQADASAPARIRDALGRLARQAVTGGQVRHLMIEGGATASAVLRALGLVRFEVMHEWAQGVVSLRPLHRPSLTVTLKPGSYPWPARLWTAVARAY